MGLSITPRGAGTVEDAIAATTTAPQPQQQVQQPAVPVASSVPQPQAQPNTGPVQSRFQQMRGELFNDSLAAGTQEQAVAAFLAERGVQPTPQNMSMAYEYLSGGALGQFDQQQGTAHGIADAAIAAEGGGSAGGDVGSVGPASAPPAQPAQDTAPTPNPHPDVVPQTPDMADAPIDDPMSDNGGGAGGLMMAPAAALLGATAASRGRNNARSGQPQIEADAPLLLEAPRPAIENIAPGDPSDGNANSGTDQGTTSGRNAGRSTQAPAADSGEGTRPTASPDPSSAPIDTEAVVTRGVVVDESKLPQGAAISNTPYQSNARHMEFEVGAPEGTRVVHDPSSGQIIADLGDGRTITAPTRGGSQQALMQAARALRAAF